MHGTSSAIHQIDFPAGIAGHGRVTLEQVDSRSVVTQRIAHSPLKILATRSGTAAWLFTSTYGGGLVDGDEVSLHLDCGSNTRCLLSTQSSTKVYRCPTSVCRQELHTTIDGGAVFVSLPDPLVCFTRAKFKQRQTFELREDAGLIALDWFTAGRMARGEKWAFDLYQSETRVEVDCKAVFLDRLRLAATDGDLNDPMRMGRVGCFGTCVIAGAKMKNVVDELLQFIGDQPSPPRGPVLFAASPINHGGAVLRFAATSTEAAGKWLADRLSFVSNFVGENPWSRKW